MTKSIEPRAPQVRVLVGVVTMFLLAAGLALATPPASAQTSGVQLKRSEWQMYVSPVPRGALSNKFTSTIHGDRGFFVDARDPNPDDPNWRLAPNADTIDFHGSVDPRRGGPPGSRLTPADCLKAVDYTYFQTTVDVPADAETALTQTQTQAQTKAQVTFSQIDDGARITVYNTKYPNGFTDASTYVTLNQPASTNLAPNLVRGKNRIVVTQLDDCPAGNNISAQIALNSKPVAVDPAPPSWAEPVVEPREPGGWTVFQVTGVDVRAYGSSLGHYNYWWRYDQGKLVDKGRTWYVDPAGTRLAEQRRIAASNPPRPR